MGRWQNSQRHEKKSQVTSAPFPAALESFGQEENQITHEFQMFWTFLCLPATKKVSQAGDQGRYRIWLLF